MSKIKTKSIIISGLIFIFCKNLYDGAYYATLDAEVSWQPSREIDLHPSDSSNKDLGTEIHSKEILPGEKIVGSLSDSKRSSKRKVAIATTPHALEDFVPSTLTNKTTWHPSAEWVHDCVQDLSSQNNALGEWNVVQKIAIADCIKFCRCYHRSLSKTTFNKLYHQRACPLTFSFPDDKSAAGDYNLSTIDEAHSIQSHLPNFSKPEPEALVIHLRLGDIIETSPSSVEELLMKGGDPGYPTKRFLNSIKSVHELLNDVGSVSDLKVVHIVGGTHRKEYWQKSRVYAGCIHRAMEEGGYNVTMRVEGIHPDEDFYYTSHAKQLIVSAGGFSNLMGQIAEHRGGRIIGRSFGVNW